MLVASQSIPKSQGPSSSSQTRMCYPFIGWGWPSSIVTGGCDKVLRVWDGWMKGSGFDRKRGLGVNLKQRPQTRVSRVCLFMFAQVRPSMLKSKRSLQIVLEIPCYSGLLSFLKFSFIVFVQIFNYWLCWIHQGFT
ncbi:uncharacterized protein LACBIDRAFT_299335 [Laccaria bicolor S238N-H82]|uniref:Predicted protein n=1 Tax=Laccaria bicolor (strain S238N-H82 / ATCC MYA-4686) TaxID=486041 RepID=B0DEI9_LACBS|nr:uncharacterized protein LACBIDRAFT_299335 [Laccaria bicolor S238N-H82]EDR07040.1 predicted protein [Laccaria bicolor S238N-H82]|eukprot:XP_001882413.1 predicted protein [Laccaria bicolor S238N-H82]